ncbi:hypothetical protein [Synechococcus sp. UW140]|uniref:hypothetical protein n=1 Tax=Synechococcus sp. UW140 TaxID=368503 RepID=UPI0010BD8E67|nr:hypothetical protein [Synechococcus sp. UW140]
MRLDDEQKHILKNAYNAIKAAHTPEPKPSIGGSTIKADTIYRVNSRLGLCDLTITDLLNTRESIALTTVLSLQVALGVVAVTKEDVLKAFDGYANYVFQIGQE